MRQHKARKLLAPVDNSAMPGLQRRALSPTFKVAVLALVVAGVWFRCIGHRWDDGTMIHPDERFLFMVTAAMETPKTFGEFLDTANSPMNPHNRNHSFFVYGTFPLFLTRILHERLPAAIAGDVILLGRMLTTLADLGTIALTFVLGRLAFGAAAGALAAVFYALSVLPIQLSHFYTVDPFATFFGVGAITLALLAARRRNGLRFAAAFGAVAACAAASKISLALVTPLWPLAVWLRLRHERLDLKSFLRRALPPCLLAGGVFIFVFRFLQPYAFAGPNLLSVRLNPKWIANLEELGRLAAPSLHFPPAIQWMNRPIWFGAKNLVLWGVGIPLGLLAFAGLVVLARRLRRFPAAPTLLVAWFAGYFLIFGLLGPVKTMRYLLPIYPVLCLAAAALLVHWRAKRRVPALVVGSVVVIATSLWAFAFSRIYTRPVTRVAASRWMYENIPGPVTLHVRGATETRRQPLSMNVAALGETGFAMKSGGEITALEIFRIQRTGPETPTSVVVELFGEQQRAVAMPLPWPMAGDSIEALRVDVNPPLPVRQGEMLRLSLKFDKPGAALKRVMIGLETPWDDALPLRVDGYDAFGGIYDGEANFEIYWAEDPKKRERLKDVLTRSDYLSISSNRQYGTLTRLKEYPMTTAFYRALLGCGDGEEVLRCYAAAEVGERTGRLGFDLVQTFESSPNLGSLRLSDQRAEEAFTVYDHPKVLLFRKRPGFETARIAEVVDRL